jgi:DNA gyrase subunit A
MEKIYDTLIEEEMRTSYIDYAMSVIVGRALPDVRDGLKPVQRRILFAMRQLGLLPNRPFRKSATVVGEVIGKYHPHGDMAVYDALVRMAQDFSLRYPLIQGQGNFGSIDGDPPAAYRYTEARLSQLAMEMLADLEEDTVDHVPNFDGRLQEPTVLPSKIPNLLINGSSGIAVGMATNIPPHNLREIVDALLLLIDNPDVSDDALLDVVKGPDFPTGGIIVGTRGIEEAYRTGHGRIVVRSKMEIEEGKQPRIVITEIPYQVTKTQIIEKIAQAVREKHIDGISDLRDESDREGLRVVVEIKKGYQAEHIYRLLLKHTPLQHTFSATLLALVDGEPKILSLREMLQLYFSHRERIVERRTKFRLRKAEERAHIVEGFIKALGMIDRVIELIKRSEDSEKAKVALVEELGFTEAQAKAILDMRLATLTRMERDKLEKELIELRGNIEEFKAILADRAKLLGVIRKELFEVREKYGDDRRTEITEDEQEDFDLEDLVPDEDVVVTLTYLGYIKRTPLRYYRQQARGGTGRSGIKVYEEDFPTTVVIVNNHDNLLFFTNLGRVMSTKVFHITEGSLQAKGRPIKNLLRLRGNERVSTLLPYYRDSKGEYVFLVTERGIVKKTPISRFKSASRRGIIAINLREGDNLIGGLLTDGNQDIIIAKSDGKAMRFSEKAVRPMGRGARGVIGTRTSDDSKVVAVVPYDPNKMLLTITEKGFGKCIRLDEIKRQKRGGLGIKIQNVTKKTGKLVRVCLVDVNDQIILLTQMGSVIRLKAKEIKLLGRYASGVKLMRVKRDDRIVDVAIVREDVLNKS